MDVFYSSRDSVRVQAWFSLCLPNTYQLASFLGLPTILFLIACSNWTVGRPGNKAAYQ